ncbi:hypothetical protein MRY87_00885 [bacterium]|nr:hypothetical protein [bacterium]
MSCRHSRPSEEGRGGGESPESLSDSECRGLVDELQRRGLSELALFFLEAHRPLRGVASQAVLISVPLLVPFFGAKHLTLLQKVLSSDRSVERLVAAIEARRGRE